MNRGQVEIGSELALNKPCHDGRIPNSISPQKPEPLAHQKSDLFDIACTPKSPNSKAHAIELG